jgi:hypothetical protein
MNRKTRAPRGSIAQAAVAYLEAHPSIESITTADLAEALGIAKNNISTQMRIGVDAGSLVREKVGNTLVYSLAAPAAPTDGPLEIASFSDGDLSFKGGCALEDGGVMLTRTQLQQLIAHVTTPHIALPVWGTVALAHHPV